MDKLEILIIDNQKFYWNSNNECLLPYELIENNIYIPNNNKNNNNNNDKDKNNNDDINYDDNNLEWYMENHDINFWENLLSRQLDFDEKKIFHGIWNEISLNLDIKMLQKNILKNFCYIKNITNNIGNCLFESLESLDLGNNDLNIKPSEMIRKNLASILLSVKTEIGFFQNLPNLTPEEIFLNHNDIEFIKDLKTKSIYIYDYDMMIYDLNSNFSWERLPTEFLLMAISRIYQVEILIYHNKTNYINKINVWTNVNDIDKIRLGQINEEHYFPLEELPNEFKYDKNILDEIINTDVKYDNYSKKFKKWSKIMINSMNSVNNNNTQNNNTQNNNIQNNDFNNLIDFANSFKKNNIVDNLNITESKIMKTNNKLTPEKIYDYEQISNFDDFDNFDDFNDF